MNIVCAENGNYVIEDSGLIYSRTTIFDINNQILIVRSSRIFGKDTEDYFKFSQVDSYDVSYKKVADENSYSDRYRLMLKLGNQNVFWDVCTEDYDEFIRLKTIIEKILNIDNVSKELDKNVVQCGGCKRYISPVEKRCIYCGHHRT